jgi:hypothetical protein
VEISDALGSALNALVDAADAAARRPTDSQAARRAIEMAQVVVERARKEGFGTEDP